MNEKTRRGKVNSLSINKKFLEKLGNILEEDLSEREKIAMEKYQARIDQMSNIIRNTSFYSEQEKLLRIKDLEEEYRHLKIPHIKIEYTFDSISERITFGSIKELLSTPFFPKHLTSFTARIGHYNDPNFTDIHVSIDKVSKLLFEGIIGDYRLSSKSEGALLKKEEALKRVFDEYQTNYTWWLYPSIGYPFLVEFIISIIIALSTTYSLFTHINFAQPYHDVALFIMPLILYHVTAYILEMLWPFYSYELSDQKRPQKAIKTLLAAMALAIIGSALFELVKKVLS